jgi:hypothetical protein
MKNELAHRRPAPPGAPEPAPATLATLDPSLDWQLARACRRVGDPAGNRAQEALFGHLGAHDEDTFWRACNERAAELATQHGVEILLAQEDRQIRIRVERFEPMPVPGEAPVADAVALPPAAPPRWPSLARWWRGRGGAAAAGQDGPSSPDVPAVETVRMSRETKR